MMEPSALSGSSCKAGISLYQSQCVHIGTMCPTVVNLLALKGTYRYIGTWISLSMHGSGCTCMCVAVPSSVPRLDPVRQLQRGSELSCIPGETPEARQLQSLSLSLSLSFSLSLQRRSNYTGHSTIYYCKQTCTCTQKRSHRCSVITDADGMLL